VLVHSDERDRPGDTREKQPAGHTVQITHACTSAKFGSDPPYHDQVLKILVVVSSHSAQVRRTVEGNRFAFFPILDGLQETEQLQAGHMVRLESFHS
jgi:hypothetical protein